MIEGVNDLKQVVPTLDLEEQDIDVVYEKLDYDRTGEITFSQFLIATLDPSLFRDERLVQSLFTELDSIQEGFLTMESIHIAMKRRGIQLTVQQVE